MKNLELKAIYPSADFKTLTPLIKDLGAEKKWTRTQTDTYFTIPTGKLKLREVQDVPAELIAYHRPSKAVKTSDYKIYQTLKPADLKSVLSHVFPIDLVIKKQRTLYLWKNLRIHLDQVDQLGHFIEFEAVLSEQDTANQSHVRLDLLLQKLSIQQEHIVNVGYYELLKKVN